MERSELLNRLEQLEQEISSETEMIARQRKMLTEADKKEVDADAIQILLVGLENLLIFHLQQREKLRAELAQLEGK
jgi:hypothetical protein